MASMLKKLDSCAYHAITSVVEGTYTGENQVLGLSDGGVDVTTEKSNIQVSDSIKEQLDDLKDKSYFRRDRSTLRTEVIRNEIHMSPDGDVTMNESEQNA